VGVRLNDAACRHGVGGSNEKWGSGRRRRSGSGTLGKGGCIGGGVEEEPQRRRRGGVAVWPALVEGWCARVCIYWLRSNV
jgi:hypothetical protein